MTNFIELALKHGFDKDIVTKVYKAINGGYFIDIYYSRPPRLFPLDSWPKKYFTKRMKVLALSSPQSLDVLYFYASLDLYALYAMSSSLLNREGYSKLVGSDLQTLRENIMKSLESEPGEESFDLQEEAMTLGLELKRLRQLTGESDLEAILNDLAYESRVFEEAKSSTPWIKAVARSNALKSVYLSGLLDVFIAEADVKLRYLASELYLDFDRLLLTYGLEKTILKIHNLDDSVLQNNYNKILNKIKEIAEYV